MAINAKQVAALRRKTGAGMMDCKKALVAHDGDEAKAIDFLQKKSLASAAKRASKVAAEGAVGSYIHSGRIGAMVEVNSETDFVARGDVFKELVKNIAMHVAAAAPLYLDASEIPEAEVAKQRDLFLGRLAEAEAKAQRPKPEHIRGKIVDGQIRKWKSQICLLEQAYVKDTDMTVGEYVTKVASTIKENLKVRRFARFELGDGIEKKEEDFAAEVAATMAQTDS